MTAFLSTDVTSEKVSLSIISLWIVIVRRCICLLHCLLWRRSSVSGISLLTWGPLPWCIVLLFWPFIERFNKLLFLIILLLSIGTWRCGCVIFALLFVTRSPRSRGRLRRQSPFLTHLTEVPEELEKFLSDGVSDFGVSACMEQIMLSSRSTLLWREASP